VEYKLVEKLTASVLKVLMTLDLK